MLLACCGRNVVKHFSWPTSLWLLPAVCWVLETVSQAPTLYVSASFRVVVSSWYCFCQRPVCTGIAVVNSACCVFTWLLLGLLFIPLSSLRDSTPSWWTLVVLLLLLRCALPWVPVLLVVDIICEHSSDSFGGTDEAQVLHDLLLFIGIYLCGFTCTAATVTWLMTLTWCGW